ncbi:MULTISPECIES: ABC transporter permease [unclassified Paracoccus (in: a-proteobacteria)]|uniref:ABC transporter permease n=1 Tax=unclassified Paracoccus (in: a-proteobacteria) TaxID=2688777 RepID=UPI0012B1A18B|nr:MULTISPECIES: ABC transporter permease [unclassified Paracoccus (in: a-proteobacteria)]UXU75464.1 ABC transporter permease [Paracoccus sp. SMMA_5]UXU81369.1 ABC transporter permease [Paracoccus sp. SMMA_5_TC]
MNHKLLDADFLTRTIGPIAVGLGILVLWQVLCTVYQVPIYLFPKPTDIWASFVNDLPALMRALKVTMMVTLQAFVLAVVVGTLIAFLFNQSRILEACLFPYAIILQVTPIVAISPLIIILIKDTRLALTVCAAIVALFPIISNTTLGLRSVDPGLVNLFKANRASRLQTLIRLRIPSALPYFFAGLRISSGLALIGAVVAEFVAGTGGLGSGLAYEILQAGFQLNIPLMFAALGLITALGILLFLAMAWLSNKAIGSWHESAAADRAG